MILTNYENGVAMVKRFRTAVSVNRIPTLQQNITLKRLITSNALSMARYDAKRYEEPSETNIYEKQKLVLKILYFITPVFTPIYYKQNLLFMQFVK
jgi:hypothetical protein